jgi:hypothetical protein
MKSFALAALAAAALGFADTAQVETGTLTRNDYCD